MRRSNLTQDNATKPALVRVQNPNSIDVFLVAALLIFSIAIFSVAFQSIKAALTNPIKNLRTELTYFF